MNRSGLIFTQASSLSRAVCSSSNTLSLFSAQSGFKRQIPGALVVTTALLMGAGLSMSCGGGKGASATTSTSPANIQGSTPATPNVDVVRVLSQKLNVSIQLPGEIQPHEVVSIYPKVTGFVNWIGVDRGSHVKNGELIIRVEAPELTSQGAEVQARVQTAIAQGNEAEAKLASDESTYQRLKAASATPGVVSGNELQVAQRAVEADRARVQAAHDGVEAARAALRSVQQIEAYLQVRAPFAGIITERNVHPGALVGPSGGPGVSVPMVRIENVSRLRLTVPVPEAFVGGIPEGAMVNFVVSAFPGEVFNGTVARIAHSVDTKTRTMPVELDVSNPASRLAPGMFAEVQWPVRRTKPSLFVPSSAVARTTERSFVVRVRDGKTEWVDVKTGVAAGRLSEVFGDLREGDQVAVRGTDELRPGGAVVPRLAPSN